MLTPICDTVIAVPSTVSAYLLVQLRAHEEGVSMCCACSPCVVYQSAASWRWLDKWWGGMARKVCSSVQVMSNGDCVVYNLEALDSWLGAASTTLLLRTACCAGLCRYVL